MVLTESGHRLLQGWTPDGFRESIDGLYNDDHFDVFNRVNNIRGQSGRGKRYLTDADRLLERMVELSLYTEEHLR